MDKGIFINEIKADKSIEGVFCVASKRLLETRSGKPYLALTLMDRSGEIEARLWENAVRQGSSFADGDYVLVQADARLFRDEVQLNIRSVKCLSNDTVNVSDFMPVAPIDLDEYEKRLDRFISSIKRDPLGPFIKSLFRKRGSIRQDYLRAPAAKKMHQAYLGGLLEHSVKVASLAQEMARLYPMLDSDLLVAGAVVHDIGKIREFRYDSPPIDYTDSGRLLGHAPIGVEIIDQCGMETGFDISHPDLMALKHMVLSHHGKHEFGASVLPMTAEAVVLHHIDDMDAKLSFLGGLSRDMEGEGPAFTPYQRLFERFFYLRGTGADLDESGCVEENTHAGKKQRDLFET